MLLLSANFEAILNLHPDPAQALVRHSTCSRCPYAADKAGDCKECGKIRQRLHRVAWQPANTALQYVLQRFKETEEDGGSRSAPRRPASEDHRRQRDESASRGHAV